MIVRSRKVMENGPTREIVQACVQEFLLGEERLNRLRASYEGQHGILKRERPSGMPNCRLVHDFPRYISTMAAGYLVGRPVRYETDEQHQDALDAVLKRYDRCAIDSVDAELARNASIFGRGVELVFADDLPQPRTASLDPAGAFVVYDDTVENRPMFGVHLTPVLNGAGKPEKWRTEVYTDRERLCFVGSTRGDVGPERERCGHFFGGVPMVEYWNGEDERGDFEGVLSLIEAYDQLQSDRVNDKSQFVDALLLLYGCTMETDERGRTPGQQLREDKLLALPDSDARAEWLCKQLNEADAEVLKKALAADIHKLSMVPELSDEQFGGTQSGVALRYKLLGLEQLTRIKERWFREALKQRLRLFTAFLSMRGEPKLDVEAVRLAFSRSLPVNGLEEAQTLNALRGLMDDESLQARAEQMEL